MFKQTLQKREPRGEELDTDWNKLQSRHKNEQQNSIRPKAVSSFFKTQNQDKVSEADSIYTGRTKEVAVELNTFSESK